MEYNALTVEKMKALLLERLENLEAHHFLAQSAIHEFEVLGEDYAQAREIEESKVEKFEKTIAVLRDKLALL